MSRKSKATKEEIQRNRDEAYQNGWSDGYAEGFGKATEAAIAALPAVMGGAAALLKDVPRHSLDFCDRMEIDKDGVWMHEDHVLAALEPVAAPDPAAPDLTDPVVVHANMLRGTIAKPTVEQIIHLYGVDALTKALAPVIVREAEIDNDEDR